jgi:hypothetical protein
MDALIAYLQVLGTFVDTESAAAQEALAKEKGGEPDRNLSPCASSPTAGGCWP